MEKSLIVGIETESGRHIIQHLAEQADVVGVRLTPQPSIPACDVRSMTQITPESILLKTDGISRVIYCGEASVSGWSAQAADASPCSDRSNLTAWSLACAEAGVPFVFLSSDGQFNGPWIFHDEDSESLLETPRAQSIRSQEALVLEQDHSLIIRSHICGFSPQSLLTKCLLTASHYEIDPALWYATPIYAGRFAQLLRGLMDQQADGIFHLGGGERISQAQLMHRLDERFHLTSKFTSPTMDRESPDSSALRETSLRSSKARRRLNQGLPNISDFLDDIARDLDAGSAAELAGRGTSEPAKVA